MWAYALVQPNRLQWVETRTWELGDLEPGDVLLRMIVGGICGSDLPGFAGRAANRGRGVGPHPPFDPGFPMHEAVGEVIASRSDMLTVGSVVVGWIPGVNGLAEYAIASDECVTTFDSSLSPSTAVMLQPLAGVLGALDRIGDVRGARVAVIGQGPIGVLFSHVLKSLGAADVTGVDVVDRGDLSFAFGVDHVVAGSSDQWSAEITDVDRPEIVIEAIGHQRETLGHAVRAARLGGQIYYYGVPEFSPFPLDMDEFFRKNLTLRSGFTQAPRSQWLHAADAYVAQHPEIVKPYITDVYGVAQVQEAYARASIPAPGRLKVVVEMRS